jgi:dTDP-glucose 4,6-dehydratase
VDDLINGLTALFFTDNIYEPINLGNPEPIQIKQLVFEIIKLTSSESKLINLPLPLDDPRQREPNIDNARKMLGWQPEIDREIGLKKTIEYFSSILTQEH